MTKQQDKVKIKLQHERVANFNRESLAPKKAVLHSTKDMERRFSEELRQHYKESTEIGESLRKIYAPLAEIVSKDKHAVAEQRKLRERLAERRKHKFTPPKVPQTRSIIKPGSIFTLVAPPYDHAWQWVDPNNTGRAGASLDTFNGSFGGYAWRDQGPAPSGYGQAAAGFAIGFHPMTEVLLTLQYQLAYNVSWFEDSNVDTAHTNGSSQILIYQYDLNWNFQQTSANNSVPIWSDETSWFETHSGGTTTTASFNPPWWAMLMSPNNNYLIWFIGRWEADGAGDPNGPFSSMARCWLDATLPFVVLEQS